MFFNGNNNKLEILEFFVEEILSSLWLLNIYVWDSQKINKIIFKNKFERKKKKNLVFKFRLRAKQK